MTCPSRDALSVLVRGERDLPRWAHQEDDHRADEGRWRQRVAKYGGGGDEREELPAGHYHREDDRAEVVHREVDEKLAEG